MTERYSDRTTRSPREGKRAEDTTREGTGRHQKSPQELCGYLTPHRSVGNARDRDVMVKALTRP